MSKFKIKKGIYIIKWDYKKDFGTLKQPISRIVRKSILKYFLKFRTLDD